MAQRFSYAGPRNYVKHFIRASAGMATLQRTIVGLYDATNAHVPAKFENCLVNHFGPTSVSVEVSCKLENNMLLLSAPSQSSDNLDLSSVTLQHSPDCPVLHIGTDIQRLSKEVLQQGIFVGVAVILESSDNKILMTQRADHMRTFPKVWVPPGGHLENGESFAEGALRELQEETGLTVGLKNINFKLLCMWESVYPILLGFGLPQKHHIVVYLHVQCLGTSEELLREMKLDPDEVQACMWLEENHVKSMFEKQADLHIVKRYTMQQDTMRYSEVVLSTIFNTTYWNHDRIYTGTQLALYHWMILCKERNYNKVSKL